MTGLLASYKVEHLRHIPHNIGTFNICGRAKVRSHPPASENLAQKIAIRDDESVSIISRLKRHDQPTDNPSPFQYNEEASCRTSNRPPTRRFTPVSTDIV